VTPLGITGKWAQERLDAVGITVNKNSIPFDKESFVQTSGIRIGTGAITTRGLKESDVELVADFILDALSAEEDEKIGRASCRKRVEMAETAVQITIETLKSI